MDVVVSIMNIANIVLLALFCLSYSYQIVYAVVALVRRPNLKKGEGKHPIAVLVAARNEEGVIPYLIESLHAQDYPKDLYRIFVVADNCTDETARVAREHGAVVFERHDTEHIGKGYAMEYLLGEIDRTEGEDAFDAYVVFDADNLVEPNFLTEICKVYDGGADIIAAYRNAKNYADSWVSAGHGMWFIRESSTLNAARVILGQGAVVAGTGFLFSRRVKEHHGGWPFHMLTEDTEFMVASHLAGFDASYAPDAEFYDEQVTTFRDSFKQRIRWCKGGIQVFSRYKYPLLRSALRGNQTSFEQLISIAPAYILMVIALVLNLVLGSVILAFGRFLDVLPVLALMILSLSVFVVFFSILTTVSQWKKIHASPMKKILYIFAFPLFMFSFIPICLCAMIMRVRWNPIPHNSHYNIDEMKKKQE